MVSGNIIIGGIFFVYIVVGLVIEKEMLIVLIIDI